MSRRALLSTVGLTLLVLGCRQSNPDWMGPGPTVSSATGDATTGNADTGDANTGDANTGDSTGGDTTGGMDCAAIDNRNECDTAPGCTWVGNPAQGECQPS